MAIMVGAEVIDALLLGAGGRRRQLQDFPVLGDVWARFAEAPVDDEGGAEVPQAHDLLITPTWERPTGEVAKLVARTGLDDGQAGPYRRQVAYIQGLVAASLTLDDLIGVAIPATKWWDDINDRWNQDEYEHDEEEAGEEGRPSDARLRQWIGWELDEALREEGMGGRLNNGTTTDRQYLKLEAEDRQAAKLGLLLGVMQVAASLSPPTPDGPPPPRTLESAVDRLGRDPILDAGVGAVRLVIRRHGEFAATRAKVGDRGTWNGLIFQVSLNRDAAPASAPGSTTAIYGPLSDSVSAIKADAARALFSINCKGIGWAVLDSGIDQSHPAFWDYEQIWSDQEKSAKDVAAGKPPTAPRDPKPHRIKATFDFRRIREIMSVDGAPNELLAGEIAQFSSLGEDEIKKAMDELAADQREGRRVNWARVRPLVEQQRPGDPPHPHGTHVAGILGANWLSFKTSEGTKRGDPVKMSGVCPDIDLYDFRILGSTLRDQEFAVIAALQFIRYLNDQSGFSRIQGVNMSLAITHSDRNYACGRTQVCVEAESLTANGVVVVAAAGNYGMRKYKLADNNVFESYAASTITDPGNAEGVITVGATHRAWPHTFGVSYFSSRGPTGDGRPKPDLLAPGEKITSCVPGPTTDAMDGTSQAAPHVSGAAALLMARHGELKGQPARIKEILCETATDLRRERSFQGHGMVDVLRAIQSV
ncbi:MAG: serine protease AprX [Sphingomonadales bacterium]|nr:serine protease AprX [Sphingomonadales bacterium]